MKNKLCFGFLVVVFFASMNTVAADANTKAVARTFGESIAFMGSVVESTCSAQQDKFQCIRIEKGNRAKPISTHPEKIKNVKFQTIQNNQYLLVSYL
ncbi:hypothetical protein [Salinivibrio sp. IB872]|uniref:hypothetical protein n=1 Tax=Salinivibrio sp. IB872 TaxID=1766123 RepID=UPI0009878E9D|nr:hypothetical protein [Salinivibrio sp. IB872]OOF24164.1 hypothetical protein BZJ18_13595 [Salinivibrio sp. IB872]